MDTFKLMPPSQHLLDIKNLEKSGIESLFSSIESPPPNLDQNIALLFFEDSTRTRLSFELAALNLGCQLLSPNLKNSSIQKGETELDTVITVAAMGVNQVVVRSKKDGFAALCAKHIGDHCRILNAGDGVNQHPTQALTDLYILAHHCNIAWTDLRVGIVGNISHSRVAHSLIDGLSIMGVQSLNLIGPSEWLPSQPPSFASCFDNLEKGLRGLHAIVVLRPQWERMLGLTREQITATQKHFRIEKRHLRIMEKGAILMHPGPVLRNEELAEELLTHPCVKINDQVAAGVAIRQALLAQNKAKCPKK